MGTSDGSVLNVTKIHDSGPASRLMNFVIVSEGYMVGQMAQFADDVRLFVDRLFEEPPFQAPELRKAINIYRLDVASTQDGADHPACSDGSRGGFFRDTYFDARFCWDGHQNRLLGGNVDIVVQTVGDWVGKWHQILVLVNDDTELGGSGGTVAWSSKKKPRWQERAIHELGHSAFGLADEYDSKNGAHTYQGFAPQEANAAIVLDPQSVKWSDLVAPGTTGIPTRKNPSCSAKDPGPSPVTAGTVGTFEGAKDSHCGVYRPEWTCIMRDTSEHFCAVCSKRIEIVLSEFLKP